MANAAKDSRREHGHEECCHIFGSSFLVSWANGKIVGISFKDRLENLFARLAGSHPGNLCDARCPRHPVNETLCTTECSFLLPSGHELKAGGEAKHPDIEGGCDTRSADNLPHIDLIFAYLALRVTPFKTVDHVVRPHGTRVADECRNPLGTPGHARTSSGTSSSATRATQHPHGGTNRRTDSHGGCHLPDHCTDLLKPKLYKLAYGWADSTLVIDTTNIF